jgi:genome maintenance exonuclease 1
MIFTHKPIDLGYKDLVCETLESGRTYLTPKGTKYPSVTTVLGILSKDDILAWRKRVGEEEANRISRRAASRGEEIHKMAERYINNETLDPKSYLPHLWHTFSTIKPILETRINNIVLQECPLYSDHLGLAGRVDLIAEFDGVLSIIDIKTSKRVKEKEDIHSYFMQETSYAIMFEERTGIPITNIVTIMAIDENEPRVFKEHRDNWVKPLKETIAEYTRMRIFGRV